MAKGSGGTRGLVDKGGGSTTSHVYDNPDNELSKKVLIAGGSQLSDEAFIAKEWGGSLPKSEAEVTAKYKKLYEEARDKYYFKYIDALNSGKFVYQKYGDNSKLWKYMQPEADAQSVIFLKMDRSKELVEKRAAELRKKRLEERQKSGAKPMTGFILSSSGEKTKVELY